MTVSGYNSTPPSDDGSQTTANQVTWAKHKTKLGDPLKTAIESLNTNVNTAFATVDDAANLTTGTLPDARLSSNVPLKDSPNTFLAAQKISGTSATLYFTETDQADDEGLWKISAGGKTFTISARSDLDATGTTFMDVTRGTGTAVTILNLVATSVRANGSEILTTSDEGAGNGLDADTVDGIEAATLRDATINSQAGDYTLVLTDAGKTIYKASGGGSETITVPANSSVAFPTGTMVTIVNQGGGDLSIAITTDTMTFAGVGTTGARTLADDGVATLLKVTSTSWIISGPGLT